MSIVFAELDLLCYSIFQYKIRKLTDEGVKVGGFSIKFLTCDTNTALSAAVL